MPTDSVYKRTLEYQEGRNAYCDGVRRGQNPYSAGNDGSKAYAWWLGWDDEESAQQAEETQVSQ